VSKIANNNALNGSSGSYQLEQKVQIACDIKRLPSVTNIENACWCTAYRYMYGE